MTANPNPIPEWDNRGLLPPYLLTGVELGNRSPYRASITDVIRRFGSTAARRQLLAGLLDFRAELHQAGLTRGFQWVNGSFVTDIVQIANREPRDIDVVTFFHLPRGYTEEDLHNQIPAIFDRDRGKNLYRIDNLFIGLESYSIYDLAHSFAYFNGLWSHTRREETGEPQWKGYLELDLFDRDDTDAQIALGQMAGR